MKRVLLCCHTGGRNRGCEAIIRSTAQLLGSVGMDAAAMTFDMQGDLNVGLDQAIKLIAYPKKSQFVRVMSFVIRKIKGNDIWGSSFYQKEIREHYKNYEYIFNVGGDTYCYTTPWISITSNLEAKKRGLKSVFWGCSIDERLDTDQILQEDINRYDYVLARESHSYEILVRNYRNQDRLFLACDPAFYLVPEETALPEGFIPYQTVGINISPEIVDVNDMENNGVIRNCIDLIGRICETTDMNICLIPHVYQIEPQSSDYKVLNKLYDRFRENPRVCLVSEELRAAQLKYIISKCRFFVGARTHSVIAAYSSCVPALALSYSIKSRGLANDVIGQEKGYALNWKELTGSTQLGDCFFEFLVKREESVKDRLESFMPAYKESIIGVLERIIHSDDR